MPKANEIMNWEGKTLLIAEDDHTNFKIVEQLLKKTNVKIIWAETGTEVLFFLKHPELAIDAVLMDIQMPELDGVEATKLLKGTFPNLPVIMLSAFANRAEYQNLEGVFDDAIAKPVKRELLFEKLNKYFSPS